MKERLDVLLVKRNLAASREKAKAIIMSGIVYVEGQKEDKAGSVFEDTVSVEVRGNTLPYVSRGGLKLEKAFQVFPIQVQDFVCIDIGASTGGFTDCMLQNGAKKVYAVMPSDSMLVKELTKAVRENIDLTTQKMTAVLAVLLEQGKVTKEMVKGNPYYTKVEG